MISALGTLPPGVRVLVATRPVDFRRGADGLAATVQSILQQDPFSGTVFVFRSKRADRVKLLVYDGTGLVLIWKRLEGGTFKWPPVSDGVMRLSGSQLAALPRAYRNIPCSEADESSIDEVKVLDPRHPLYGRSFRVLRRSTHLGGNFPPSYEVEYRNESSLLIPVAATEWHDLSHDQLKLCLEALRDLVCAIDCLDSHDEHKSERPLGNTVAGSEAAGSRRPRRRPGGGRS
jgi:transposase